MAQRSALKPKIPQAVKPEIIPIGDFILGGMADSPYIGLKNSVSSIVGFDIHKIPGLAIPSQKMTKESTAPTDDYYKILPCSDGNIYLFGKTNGKIYINSGGTYTYITVLSGTLRNGMNTSIGILDAIEYSGFVFFFTQQLIYYTPLTSLSTFGGSSASFADLDLEQAYNTTAGHTYTLPSAISESSTDKFPFTPIDSILTAIKVNVAGAGSGTWTVTIHDSNNTVIGTATTTVNSAGDFFFKFSSALNLNLSTAYHLHITSSNGTGTVSTATTSDLSTGKLSTYTSSDPSFHPTIIQNNVLYFGDKFYLNQIDASSGTPVYTKAALKLDLKQRISGLGKQVTDLLIGTFISNNVPQCHVFRWDTWSVSYTNDYTIPEAGVNSFLQAGDASVIVQVGLNGNFYMLNGSVFSLIKRIPSNFPTLYTPSNTCISYYSATAVLEGIPVIGISNLTGNPCYEGVYAFGSRSVNYPTILSLPYVVSTGNLSGITIWSIAVLGTTLYISSYDSTTSTYQIDKLDFTAKYNKAFIETLIIKFSKIWLDNYEKIVVNYQQLPSGCNINLYYDANWAGYTQIADTDLVIDTDRNLINTSIQPRAKTMRFKIEAIVSGNNAPYIEDAYLEVA